MRHKVEHSKQNQKKERIVCTILSGGERVLVSDQDDREHTIDEIPQGKGVPFVLVATDEEGTIFGTNLLGGFHLMLLVIIEEEVCRCRVDYDRWEVIDSGFIRHDGDEFHVEGMSEMLEFCCERLRNKTMDVLRKAFPGCSFVEHGFVA